MTQYEAARPHAIGKVIGGERYSATTTRGQIAGQSFAAMRA